MTSMPTEQQEIERIAQEYRDRGYAVIVDPRGDDLPDFLEGTHPDVLAYSSTEKVVIEVKQTRALRQSSDIAELASRVEGHRGWRFELITVGSSSQDTEWLAETQRWTAPDIRKRLEESRLARDAGYCHAAFLLAYAALEAAAFLWMKSDRAPQTKTAPTFRTVRAIVRQMVIDGALSQPTFASFQSIEELRHRVAHGVANAQATRTEVDTVVDLASAVLDASGHADITPS